MKEEKRIRKVDKGSIFALLGSNGAGKTTTIRILAALIKADGGIAAVGGFDAASKPDTRLCSLPYDLLNRDAIFMSLFC